MLCRLTRWLISRAEDGGKEMPRFAGRHAARCGACREYARFAGRMSQQFSGEMPAFLAKVPDTSWDPAGLEAEILRTQDRTLSRRRLALRPLPAAAAVLLAAAAALVLFQVVKRDRPLSSAEKRMAIADLKSVAAAPAGFEGAVAEADSLLDRERRILENSVVSAFEYLQDRLNIMIERRDIPKTL